MTILVNEEQIDPCGIVYSCIACCDEATAEECRKTLFKNLSEQQKQEGWTSLPLKPWTLPSDEVSLNALKLGA